MGGHVFMSNGLKDRIQDSLKLSSENTVFIHKEGSPVFVSGYRSFGASPGILSVEGALTTDIPSWLFDSLGSVVAINITLRSTTITRSVILSNVSIDHDNESWTVAGEIFNPKERK